MPSQSPPKKRTASDAPISPPPVKRKVQSGTTKSAVANFFTPTSQRPKDATTCWSERSPNDDIPATLLVGSYRPTAAADGAPVKRCKIAAFDLDSTLIKTSSGKKHASGAADWKWWDPQVPSRLRQLHEEEGYRIAILSNQAGLTLQVDPSYKGPIAAARKRVNEFKQKCSAVLESLQLPISIYAATGKDMYRKPRTGMWSEVCEDYDIQEAVDREHSFFVGDAGGRVASLGKGTDGAATSSKDFSCSDRDLAANIGINFMTPEEFFLGEKPREFARDFDLANYPGGHETTSEIGFEKTNSQDIVLLCGSPGAGKSTFYWKVLEPLDYKRVNQDILKTRDNCVKTAAELLQDGSSVAIDNTNADTDTRKIWIQLAERQKVPIRCIWLSTPQAVSQHNDAARSMNKALNREDRQVLPKVAFTGFASRFKPPNPDEGFQDVTEVAFTFRGSEEEYKIWGRYWA